MKEILGAQGTIGSVLARDPDSGRMKLIPHASLTLLIGEKMTLADAERPFTQTRIVTVDANAEELRRLAENCTRLADDLERMVEPLCENRRDITREEAVDIMREISKEEHRLAKMPFEAGLPVAKRIEREIRALAEAGWDYRGLREEFEGVPYPPRQPEERPEEERD